MGIPDFDLMYGTADPLRRWVIPAPDAKTAGQQVGDAEKGRFVGRIWQGLHLLETALRELDADGWELVSVSFSGNFTFYGCAVVAARCQATLKVTRSVSEGVGKSSLKSTITCASGDS